MSVFITFVCCKEIAEAQETLKHRRLCGSQFWLLEGQESMVPVSWSGCSTASQHSTEADRKMGTCTEESCDKQEGPNSLFIATTLTDAS